MASQLKNPLVVSLEMIYSSGKLAGRNMEMFCVHTIGKLVGGFQIPALFSLGGFTAGAIRREGAQIWADTDICNVPSSARNRARIVTGLQTVNVFTVLTSRLEIMQAVVEGRQMALDELADGDEFSEEPTRSEKDLLKPLIFSIPFLSHLEEEDSEKGILETALRRTKTAVQAGLDGVIVSGELIEPIRQRFDERLLIAATAVRPASLPVIEDDQKRTTTPREALLAGADVLIIGRPITQSFIHGQTPSPEEATQRVLGEIINSQHEIAKTKGEILPL